MSDTSYPQIYEDGFLALIDAGEYVQLQLQRETADDSNIDDTRSSQATPETSELSNISSSPDRDEVSLQQDSIMPTVEPRTHPRNRQEIRDDFKILKAALKEAGVLWVAKSRLIPDVETEVEFMETIWGALTESREKDCVLIADMTGSRGELGTDKPNFKLIPRQIYKDSPTMAIEFGTQLSAKSFFHLLPQEERFKITRHTRKAHTRRSHCKAAKTPHRST